jgi:site-specific DNA recombinase
MNAAVASQAYRESSNPPVRIFTSGRRVFFMKNSSTSDSLQPRLMPRIGHILLVLGIARISTVHQDQRSLADQEALYRAWLDRHAGCPYHLVMIAGRGSGESLDREESRQARAAVESGRYDLVIAEDLGRIFRRVHAQLFCELCLDYETRLIAINDQVDTAQENWRVLAGFASMRHEMYNADTAKRIRRSLRNRFVQGGVVQAVVYGYIKPPGAKTDAELRKDPDAEPIYDEIFRKLEDGASYSEVADWLNEQSVKPGPAARTPRWTCSLVTQLLHNPILKGVRLRNKMMSKRVNQTGHHRSITAPAFERLERHCPHLAFIEPTRYDHLIALLDERNARFRRKGVQGVDTRKNTPKKRTVWPGQHLDCGVCGRPFVYGGHGQKDHLICRGAQQYRCWNAFTVDGPLAARKLMEAIHASIVALPDFDSQLIELVQEEERQHQGDKAGQQQELARQLSSTERELQNLLAAVRASGHSPILLDDLSRLEKQKTKILWEQQQLLQVSDKPLVTPSAAEIRRLAERAFAALAPTSPEFGRLLHRLIPRIIVYPFQLCDGGKVAQRAYFLLYLARLLPPGSGEEPLTRALQQALVVDLYDPPQREAYRAPVMELTANGLKQRDIAWELGITQPAVQWAVALHRRMQELQITDPYLRLEAPPENESRLCRHLHPRYRFEALPDRPEPPPSS